MIKSIKATTQDFCQAFGIILLLILHRTACVLVLTCLFLVSLVWAMVVWVLDLVKNEPRLIFVAILVGLGLHIGMSVIGNLGPVVAR